MSATKKNLHVPLPAKLHARLRDEAARTGRPATSMVREAVEVWLTERERRARHEAIAAYARGTAGTGDDLLTDVEAAAAEHLWGAFDGEAESAPTARRPACADPGRTEG